MQLYHTTDTDGISELNPDSKKMLELLTRLDEPGMAEAEHPDVSLVHDSSGWSLSVFPSGVVTFENLDDEDNPPRFMTGVTRHEALQLWLELSRGEIEQVNSRPWLHE